MIILFDNVATDPKQRWACMYYLFYVCSSDVLLATNTPLTMKSWTTK